MPAKPAPKTNGESSTMATRGSKKQARAQSEESRVSSPAHSADESISSSPSRASSSSRTPSPIASSDDESRVGLQTRQSARKRKLNASHEGRRRPSGGDEEEADPARYGDVILEYFISDLNTVPSILINPPHDFDPNMALDDDGHTPLHWACAMGRTRVVKLLLTAGADMFKVNKQGQTALMRSVMFANNYDVRKFPELYELLHRSTLNIDNSNRTVFHHIVDVAMGKGKPQAARYYMETLLAKLSDFPQELSDIINFQDEDGETALTMAARLRSKRLVKLLIDHGANPKIRNHDGKTCEDYILEDERFRRSPGSRALPLPNATSIPSPKVYHHDIARKAAGQVVSDMTAVLERVASQYDEDLSKQERDLAQARFVLETLQAETAKANKTLQSLSEKAAELEKAQGRLKELETTILDRLESSYRRAWTEWHTEEAGKKEPPVSSDAIMAEDPMNESDRLDEADLAQIEEFYKSPASMSKEQIEQECTKIRDELAARAIRRAEMFQKIVKELSEAGNGENMEEYRKLIAAGLGGIPPSEVDELIGPILEMIQSEHPVTAMNGAGPSSGVR
ncbi:ankyrin [Clavulina sp. PMI_390]|nr:ankyrin [Clavulina sp. PMI_390]